MKDTVVYDIETFPSNIILNGKETELMRMSVAVTFDYNEQYKVWFENDIQELIQYLLKFKRIVGFAIKGFDNIILDQYNEGAKQELDAKSFDLLEIIESRLGHKVSLNNIASPTLKLEKSGDGEKAIEWWLKGEKERVIEYCKDDVRITKELYEYGIANKEIFFNSFGEIRKLSIDWNQEQKYNPADFVYTLTDDESGKEILLDKENKEFFNALELAKTTNRILYITGKAGTGKTTFLKYLKKNINKNTVVLAYTGVAAINAGGQTLNSFFQINPFDPPFLPDDKRLRIKAPVGDADETNIFNHFKYNFAKLELIKSLELLVIDEVSVVRADFIDVIDNILRVYSGKDSDLPFGGVQVIFIGDAFQLPPIEGTEWEILKEFYESPFFFSSRAFQENPPIHIELEKIYRQKESGFINLLNRVRINEPTKEDFILLNRKLRPITNSLFDQNYVVLCSTNQQVNEINSSRLNSIQGEELIYEGEIIGDFKASSGVTQKNLALKEGAQIMFLKNGNQYYNGKIGTIEKLTANEIIASTANNLGVKTKFIVEKATWLNVKYTYNRQKHKIEQEIIGSFTQYPIKLAWAITVHKSQGLTFEKVIINISDFTPSGLVYVALSRCASLDGLILAYPILRKFIKTDQRVIDFAKKVTSVTEVIDIISKGNSTHHVAQPIDISVNKEDRKMQFDKTLLDAPVLNNKQITQNLECKINQAIFGNDAIARIFNLESLERKPYIEWVLIPKGTFLMGSLKSESIKNKNETQHQVTLHAYKISKYQITFDQYDIFCIITNRSKPYDYGWGRGNRPAIIVNWYDAMAFAEFVGCSLPTEAQWEYACRAGTTTPFNTGKFLTVLQANCYSSTNATDKKKEIKKIENSTMPVGSYPPNAWGLYDMHGNVWEWCYDIYNPCHDETQIDPTGPLTGPSHVLRGGGWTNVANRCRSASRFSHTSENCFNDAGFRLVSYCLNNEIPDKDIEVFSDTFEDNSFPYNSKRVYYGFRQISTSKTIIDTDYYEARNFSEGLACIGIYGKYGFIDKDGDLILPPIYDQAEDFFEGRSCVRINQYFGTIDKTGKVVIPIIFNSIGTFKEGIAKVSKNKIDGGGFSSMREGYIDINGNEIIDIIYDFVDDIKDGLIRVEYGNNWEVYNTKGQRVVQREYDFIGDFIEGIAKVRFYPLAGLIDVQGNEIVPPKYDTIDYFNEGLARVRLNGKYGFIDKYGVEVIPLIYEWVGIFENGLAEVNIGGEIDDDDDNGYKFGCFIEGGMFGFIDKLGNIIVPFKSKDQNASLDL